MARGQGVQQHPRSTPAGAWPPCRQPSAHRPPRCAGGSRRRPSSIHRALVSEAAWAPEQDGLAEASLNGPRCRTRCSRCPSRRRRRRRCRPIERHRVRSARVNLAAYGFGPNHSNALFSGLFCSTIWNSPPPASLQIKRRCGPPDSCGDLRRHRCPRSCKRRDLLAPPASHHTRVGFVERRHCETTSPVRKTPIALHSCSSVTSPFTRLGGCAPSRWIETDLTHRSPHGTPLRPGQTPSSPGI
jgi:hypothetical protein